MQNAPAPRSEGAMVPIEQHRAIQEVQASMIIAKKFPRDPDACLLKIEKACERYSLAEKAMYAYPRGGQMIQGESIRLMEVIAQNWENLDFGIRELSRDGECSEVEAFAWDKETNVKQVKVFSVPHIRYSKSKGNVKLTDPRDIYEMVANLGARRLRACIQGVIPGDITEAARKKCEATLQKGDGKPLADRVRDMLRSFAEVGVTKEMIETRLQHKTAAIVMPQLIELGKIFNSIRDGMSKREDWFGVKAAHTSEESADLTSKIKGEQKPLVSDPESATTDEDLDHKALCAKAYGEDTDNMMAAMQQLNLSNLPTSKKAAKELYEKYQAIKEA